MATPVAAIRLGLDLPATMNVNTTYSFTAAVNIEANESVPLTSLRLDINGPTPAWVVFNIDGTINSQSGAFVSIVQLAAPDFGWGNGFAQGFGYKPDTGFGNYTETFGYGYGYGYSYDPISVSGGYGYGLGFRHSILFGYGYAGGFEWSSNYTNTSRKIFYRIKMQ